MAQMNRREVLSEVEIHVVYCVNRCLRRGFLCGSNPLTGRDDEHWRESIRNRLEFLVAKKMVRPLNQRSRISSP